MKLGIIITLTGLVVLMATIAPAQVPTVPRFLDFQGDLGGGGGNRDMTFNVYDNPNPASGTLVWSERHPTVPVAAGLFSVYLGSISNNLDLTNFPFNAAGSTNRWLEIIVGGNTLAPRIPFVSAPYAFRATDAARLGGLSADLLTGHLTMTNTAKIWGTNIINSAAITDGTITNDDIAANANITGTTIRAATTDERGTVELATGTETAAGLAVQASDPRLSDARTTKGAAGGDLTGDYPNPTIKDSAVTSGKINDGAVATADIADGAVTTAKIDDGDVTTAKINDSAVTTAKINDSAVTSAKINDSAVTTAKINDSAITSAKINDGTIADADIAANANIAGNKINPVFSSLDVTGAALVRSSLTVQGGDIWLEGGRELRSPGNFSISAYGGQLSLNPSGGNVYIGGAGGSQYGTLAIKQAAAGQRGIWLEANQNNNAISLHHDGSVAYLQSDFTGGSGSFSPLALQMTGGNVHIGRPTGTQYGTLAIKQSAPGQKGIWLQAYGNNNNSISIHHDGSVAHIGTDYTGSGSFSPLTLQAGVGQVIIGPTAHEANLDVSQAKLYVGGNVGFGRDSYTYQMGIFGSTVYPFSFKNVNLYVENHAGVKGTLYYGDLLPISSDTRVKFDQTELDYGLEKVMALKPKRYNLAEWEYNKKTDKIVIYPDKSKNDIGLVAQDMHKIIPEAVSVPANQTNQLWSVNYLKLIPVLIKAIQDQQEQIENLKDKITLFEEKLEEAK